MNFNIKNTSHKYAANFCEKLEGNKNYWCTTAEWRCGMEMEKDEYSGWIQITFNIKNIQ